MSELLDEAGDVGVRCESPVRGFVHGVGEVFYVHLYRTCFNGGKAESKFYARSLNGLGGEAGYESGGFPESFV